MHLHLLLEQNSELNDQVIEWSKSTNSKLYLSVDKGETTGDEWFEQALVFGRRKSCGYAFLLTTDILLSSDALLNLIDLGKTVVSPLVIQPFAFHSNGKGLVNPEHLVGSNIELLRVGFKDVFISCCLDLLCSASYSHKLETNGQFLPIF